MTQQTAKQARVVDAVLTAVARGYSFPWAPIANILFPNVPVTQRGGTVIEFGPQDFRLINSARAPGTETKRVQFGHSGAAFQLLDYSLEALVPIELGQEAASIGIDKYEQGIRGVQRMMDIERENQAATIARDASKYGADNKKVYTDVNARWDDVDSDPIGDVETARKAVRQSIGVYPDTLVVSPNTATALSRHPDILATLTDADIKLATLAQIARALNVERVVVGDGSYHNGTKFVDIWGSDAVLAYTRVVGLLDGGSPAYGYTYQLEGHPYVEEPYVSRNRKAVVAPVTDCRAPVLAGALAGYLFQNVVTPAA